MGTAGSCQGWLRPFRTQAEPGLRWCSERGAHCHQIRRLVQVSDTQRSIARQASRGWGCWWKRKTGRREKQLGLCYCNSLQFQIESTWKVQNGFQHIKKKNAAFLLFWALLSYQALICTMFYLTFILWQELPSLSDSLRKQTKQKKKQRPREFKGLFKVRGWGKWQVWE